MRDIRSENLSTVNKLYYFPGHDLISGQEVALGRFFFIFLDDENVKSDIKNATMAAYKAKFLTNKHNSEL